MECHFNRNEVSAADHCVFAHALTVGGSLLQPDLTVTVIAAPWDAMTGSNPRHTEGFRPLSLSVSRLVMRWQDTTQTFRHSLDASLHCLPSNASAIDAVDPDKESFQMPWRPGPVRA